MTELSQADLTILYGSQTGNAEFLAYNIHESAKKAGLQTELLTLNDALEGGTLSWQRLLIVTSTHDNGHMPDNADAFWQWLQSCGENQYADLPYAVLSIGDSMYDDFCKAGQDFDARLSALGGVRMLERIDCDVDYDMTSGAWVKKLLAAIPEITAWSPVSSVEVDSEVASLFTSAPEEWHHAKLAGRRLLNGAGSQKRVLHFDIDLPEGFAYSAGDSIDIRPRNSEQLVEEWLRAFPAAETVRIGDEELPFSTALRERLELRLPHIGMINTLITSITSSEAADQIRNLLDAGDRQEIDAWLWGRDVLDVVNELGFGGTAAQKIVDILRPLQSRSYSIASSPAINASRLSLTVSSISYTREGRVHFGAGTSFLEGLPDGSEISIRRIVAHDFRLPTDESPVVMIGPGVGVAPFIGFLQELSTRERANDAWLFFGDQHRESDWLYGDQLGEWQASGVLTRLNLAFSRDQVHKHYVQHEILSEATELRSWIDRGAHIYICGDKNRMARDVENALLEVLAPPGQSGEAGAAALEELKQSGRYAKDVY